MDDTRVFLTKEGSAKIAAGLAKVDELANALYPQGSTPRDHLNWQLVQFVCDQKNPGTDYYHGKVMLGEGKEIGDCHIRSGIKAIDLTLYYQAVMVEIVDNTPVFFVPSSDSSLRFKLLEDLYVCGSAKALPVYFEDGQWCSTDSRCPGGGSGSGSGSGETGSGAAPSHEITVYDSIGLRLPPKKRRDGSGKVPGLLGEKDDVGFAIWKGDSQRWEVQAIGDSCCVKPNEYGSGSGGSGSGSGQTDCCDIEVLHDVDIDFAASCVGGSLTLTKTTTKTYKTYRVACCDE